jgi:hypothetical protein
VATSTPVKHQFSFHVMSAHWCGTCGRSSRWEIMGPRRLTYPQVNSSSDSQPRVDGGARGGDWEMTFASGLSRWDDLPFHQTIESFGVPDTSDSHLNDG